MLLKREPFPQPHNYALLPVGRGQFALVDHDVFAWACRKHWRLVKSSHCFYVVRRFIESGRTVTVRLHVEIMQPPPGYEVHHKNLNPLDNRRENLENLTPSDHRLLHGKG
jgi:hypothetical protein